MRIIVTGAGGFIGWYLVDHLVRRGDAVQAWQRRATSGDWDLPVDVAAVDITDRAVVAAQLERFAPDAIIHLAAQSFPGQSWEEPARTYEVNVVGAINLLEAARGLPRPPRVLLAGSSAEYAEPVDARAIAEDAATQPNSPYGASKLAVDHLAQLYGRRYELHIVRFRPFFLIGPRKTGDVCSDFARRVVAIERGEVGAMRVGELDMVRDFIDVRDGVSGIVTVLDSGRRGEVYNVSGGVGVSVGEVLDTLQRLAQKPIAVVQDAALVRQLDQKTKIGNSSKLRALGWTPLFVLDKTLSDILQYWRAQAEKPK